MKEEKENKKSGVIKKIIITTLLAAGAGYLAYKFIPGVKGKVDSLLPKNNSLKFETKPFRKYEIYNNKK